MDAKELRLQSDLCAWICSRCNTVWYDQEIAAQCCAPTKCEGCGRAGHVGRALCSVCENRHRTHEDEVRFKSADKIWYFDYECPYFYWAGPHESGGFFRSKHELEAFCSGRNIEVPRWVWACEPLRFLLDAEAVLASAHDRQFQPVRELIADADMERLQHLLDEWAMGLDLKAYDVDYETAIIFDQALLDALKPS